MLTVEGTIITYRARVQQASFTCHLAEWSLPVKQLVKSLVQVILLITISHSLCLCVFVTMESAKEQINSHPSEPMNIIKTKCQLQPMNNPTD